MGADCLAPDKIVASSWLQHGHAFCGPKKDGDVWRRLSPIFLTKVLGLQIGDKSAG